MVLASYRSVTAAQRGAFGNMHAGSSPRETMNVHPNNETPDVYNI